MRDGRIDRENPPKLCGADVELANFVVGDKPIEGSPRLASRLLLHEMPGLSAYRSWSPPASRHGNSGYTSGYGVDGGYGYSSGYGVSSRTGSGYSNPQDWGRKYLAENGGCAYIDLDHLELALPECISAYDHVAAWHGMLRLAQTALAGANAKLPSGQRIHLLANNSDGLGHSYGSHLNFLVTRRAFDDIFTRRIQPMLTLAAHQASSIVFAGAGKVGTENGMPSVNFQLSQRADFVETLLGPQTTFRRPLINSRDEPLCGPMGSEREEWSPGRDFARLHVILLR